MRRTTLHQQISTRTAAFALIVSAFVSVCAQQNNGPEKSLAALFEIYKTARKKPCGQRSEAVRIGKEIIEKFDDDENSYTIFQYLKPDLSKLESEDKICARNSLYNISYFNRNWSEFFAAGKQIIAEEGETPLALDIVLELVVVGHYLSNEKGIDSFNKETLDCAESAIRQIEAGQTSKTGKFGVFQPSKTKENALGWMNYVIGWLSYHKFDRKREALSYFNRAIESGGEIKTDVSLYLMLGSWYFDEAARLDQEYRAKRRINNNEETDEAKRLLEESRGYADRSLAELKKAYQSAVLKKMKKETVDKIYRKLADLYRIRHKIAPGKKLQELDLELKRLIEQPSDF